VEPFPRQDGVLHAEGVSLEAIAEGVGTPVYVYSRSHMEHRYRTLVAALEPRGADICYAVKANSNLSVLRCFAELGAGFDIVSGGELQRVVTAGGDPGRVIFSGVGKRTDELDLALKLGIRCFNVESAAELERLAGRARVHGRRAPVSVRVNPDVDARTHPYISTGLKHSKFGVAVPDARELYRRASADDALDVVGIDCHIGSQITDSEPLLAALDGLLELVDELRRDGISLSHIDLGGGLGVRYHAGTDEEDFDAGGYGAALNQRLADRPERLVLEPGRYLVANAGVLLTRVEYLKPATDAAGSHFAVVDAAMNDLIRPALYQAWHDVLPVKAAGAGAQQRRWSVVGPVCESGDFLAHDRELSLAGDDLLVLCTAGAYGMVQSSNYNTRGRPAEVLVQGSRWQVIRRRETVRDQLAAELPDDNGTALGSGALES